MISRNPSSFRQWIRTAVQHHQAGRLAEAEAIYREILSIDSDYFDALHLLGVIAHQVGQYDEAVRLIGKAIGKNSSVAPAFNHLGLAYRALNDLEAARACFRKALSLDPDFVEARWALAMSELPSVYGSEDVAEKSRTAFPRALTELDAWFDTTRIRAGFSVVGNQPPFHLAYQEHDNRGLLSQYGNLCARLMKHWLDEQGLTPAAGARSGTIRVAIVSAHVYDHSVWNAIIKGWCRYLDRRCFSLHIFHIGTEPDQETVFAQSSATYFLQGAKGLREWVDAILGQRLDVIIYPEIGMDSMTVKLASLRLAPVQVAAWGHPETTGLPTIDYYLSAEAFEPADAEQYYREQLVALPHLGCCYQRLPVTAVDPDFVALGIDADIPLLICAGTPLKYAPRHDWIFVEIARRLGRCQFVFFKHLFRESLSDQLLQRLKSVFAQSGLEFHDYGVCIPWQNRPAFYGLMQRADVYLDTIGFSGFNTAMQAVECGLPIVTLEGRFMRGRLASGILNRMGLPELVAGTEAEYANVVIRLVQEPEYRRRVREHIEASRHILFDDVAPIRALEEFLTRVTSPS
jgi:protein O-GlcNAc transferase